MCEREIKLSMTEIQILVTATVLHTFHDFCICVCVSVCVCVCERERERKRVRRNDGHSLKSLIINDKSCWIRLLHFSYDNHQTWRAVFKVWLDSCTHVVMHHMQRISLSGTMLSCWASLAISWLRWLVAVSSWPVALEAWI